MNYVTAQNFSVTIVASIAHSASTYNPLPLPGKCSIINKDYEEERKPDE